MSIVSIHGGGVDGGGANSTSEKRLEKCVAEERIFRSLSKLPAPEAMVQHIQARLAPTKTDERTERGSGSVYKILSRRMEGAQATYEQNLDYATQTIRNEDQSALKITVTSKGITTVTLVMQPSTGGLDSVYVRRDPNTETAVNSSPELRNSNGGDPHYEKLAETMERLMDILNSDAVDSGAVTTMPEAS